MGRAYGRLPELDEVAMGLGRKIVNILVEANVPYVKALDALEAAESILEGETRPTIAEIPR